MRALRCAQHYKTSKVDKVGVSRVVKKDLCGLVQTSGLSWSDEKMAVRQRGVVYAL